MTRPVAIRNMIHNNSDTAPPQTMPAESETGLDIEALSPRQLRTVLVCDVVESVRWMEHDEDNAITRWSQFAAAVRCRIAPEHAGSVVKSTGDGLMLEFENAPQAVAAANAMQKLSAEGNVGFEPERQMHLRVGIHQAQVRRDAHDLYGHGVNLAARISTLAGPGEIIVSPEVRDHLTDSLDGDIEDMGECYLKHLSEPQRVYRVVLVQRFSASIPALEKLNGSLKLAVIPFAPLMIAAGEQAVGDLMADTLIAHLGQSKQIKVISRLSTQRFRDQQRSPNEIAQILGVSHVLSGSVAHSQGKYVVLMQLSDALHNEVIWSHRATIKLSDWFAEHSIVSEEMAASIHDCLTHSLIGPALTKPLPSIQSYGLLLAGLHMMHRPSFSEFEKSLVYFDNLVDRHGRHASARAWRARWRLMSVINGLSADPKRDSQMALQDAREALQLDATHPLSLAVYGQINNQLMADSIEAVAAFENALQRDASQSLAWLFKSIHSSMWGDTSQAIIEAEQAHALSKLDPHQYHYQMALANAYLADGQHVHAIEHAHKSLKLNASHAATLRILITALHEQGKDSEARLVLQRLLKLRPQLTLKSHAGMGSQESRTRMRSAAALSALGIPDH
jgi:adenylate cyclase